MTQGGERCRERGRARTEPETQRLSHWQAGRESTKELEREPTRRGGSPMKEGSPWKPRGKWFPNSNVAEKSQKLKTEGCLPDWFQQQVSHSARRAAAPIPTQQERHGQRLGRDKKSGQKERESKQ